MKESLTSPRCCRQRAARKIEKTLPNGSWAPFPAVWSFIAWTLTIASTCTCSFVSRRVSLRGVSKQDLDREGVLLYESHGIGFWGWENEGSCYSFEIEGRSPSFDGQYTAASAFTTITDIVGGALVVCLMLGTCFPVQPNRYLIIGYVMLVIAVMDGATLIMLGSSVCSNKFFDYATPNVSLSQFANTSCGMATGSVLALLSSILWLVAAGFCLRTPLSDKKREPKEANRTASIVETAARPEHDENDEAHQLYQKRREETERRYREMFGDDADDDDANGEPFQSIRKNKLSLVQEESEHDPNISGHSAQRKTSEHYDEDGEDEDDDDGYDDDDAYEDYKAKNGSAEEYEDEYQDGHHDDDDRGSRRSSYYDDDDEESMRRSLRSYDDDRSRVSSKRSKQSSRRSRRHSDDDMSQGSRRSYRSRGRNGHDDELVSLTNSEIA